MTPVLPQNTPLVIRSVQYRDLEAAERLCAEMGETTTGDSISPVRSLKPLQPWHGVFRWLGWLLDPFHCRFGTYLAEKDHQIQGIIRVSPFNCTRSTWRVDQVLVNHADVKLAAIAAPESLLNSSPERVPVSQPHGAKPLLSDVGSQLLRYCFTTIWEARTWLLEVDVNNTQLLALYRQNGFQPLAHTTYWDIAAESLQILAEREPDLPNLLPVSNADAQLLSQLDTASMPPLVRQVFDRHLVDFRISLLGSLMEGVRSWLNHVEVVSGYVFEPQRKAAIGYFQLRLCRDASQPHQAQLTVHPAYTWLYPELMSQMARITQDFPPQSLQMTSSDYHPEREEYLERVGAIRIAHTLMMSRSVWHKLREAKPVSLEGLQLSDVLQGLQPSRKPVPGRISLLKSVNHSDQAATKISSEPPSRQLNTPFKDSSHSAKKLLRQPAQTDFSDPPQEGPCC